MNLPQVNIGIIALKGGTDQITPTLSLPDTYARDALNFECGVTGGYTRIAGYERFDGHTSPTDASTSGEQRLVSVASYDNTPAVGNSVTTSGGAAGVIAYITGTTMVLVKVTGTLTVGHTISVGATQIGTLDSVTVAVASASQSAIITNAIADIYRADISAVPGAGSILGVIEFNDVKYAFRNAAGGATCDIYKSTASGWSKVSLYKTVSFTGGGTGTPADADTLTQGGVTATIKRVVRTSGDWKAGTAAGQFIITTPAGGNFSAASATAGSVGVTLSGAQTAISLQPGGSYEMVVHNFSGQTATTRIYGVDGENPAFEFDGDVYVPIYSGAETDTPSRINIHKNYLFLGVESSMIHSAPGLPYDFTALSGASEIAVGDTITGMITMPGGTGSATMGVFARSNTYILYGSSPSDWQVVAYNTGTGAVAKTLQNMAQTYVFDDRGVNAVQTSLQYGNFSQSALTSKVLPFVTQRIGKASASTLCRKKSQYRVFFNDGYSLYITLVNNTLMGCMPVYYPDAVVCTYEGKNSTGQDVMLFGCANGMVYEAEKGTSFDGAEIPYYLTMNYSNSRSPRTLKRYRKAVPEITTESGTYSEFQLSYSLGYGSSEYERPPMATYDQLTGKIRWDAGLLWDSGLFWDTAGYAPLECSLEGTAENIAMLITGTSDYVAPFTINSFLIHYTLRRNMR